MPGNPSIKSIKRGIKVIALCMVLGSFYAGQTVVAVTVLSFVISKHPGPLFGGYSGRQLLEAPVYGVVFGAPVGAACSPFAILFLRRKNLRVSFILLWAVCSPLVLILFLLGPTIVRENGYLLFGAPAVLFVACCAFVSRLQRDLPNPPEPEKCCTQCGYNLRGNVSGRCPECGLLI